MKYVVVGVSANGYGTVFDYLPKATYTTNGQISGSIPWGVSLSMDIGPATNVVKYGGGVGSNWVEMQYLPMYVNQNLPTNETMACQVVADMWQDTSNCYLYNGTTPYPNYYMGKVRYDVEFYKFSAQVYTYIATRSNSSTANGY